MNKLYRAVGAALVCAACVPKDSPSFPMPELFPFAYEVGSDVPVRSSMLFVFDSLGVCTARSDSPEGSFLLKEGLYTAVAFVNAPGTFNAGAVLSTDMLESLSFDFSGEMLVQGQAGQPLSGSVTAQFGVPSEDVPFRLNARPLCSTVVLRSISNRFGGDTLMENPRIRLDFANASAEALRWSGFRPSTTLSTSEAALPCDIGRSVQYPGTRLYCYPNDAKDALPVTELALEYEVKGLSCLERHPVPCLRRAGTVYLDL